MKVFSSTSVVVLVAALSVVGQAFLLPFTGRVTVNHQKLKDKMIWSFNGNQCCHGRMEHAGASSRSTTAAAANSRRILPGYSTQSMRTTHMRLWQSSSSSSDESDSTIDPDRARRRQLVFSLLTAATTAPLVGTSAKAATAVPTSTETTTTTTTTKVLLPPVITPPLDDREYRSLMLPNGLRVLLCSDTSTNEAAVAMDVHVGATSDPDNVKGLAHFCGTYVRCVVWCCVWLFFGSFCVQ